MTASGNDLYVGGNFTTVGGNITVSGLAKLSGSTWSAVGGTPPWKASDDPPSSVRAIAWNGSGQMYVTGHLTSSSGSTMNHIFLLQNGSWDPLVPNPGLYKTFGNPSSGYALAVDRYAGKVFVGGLFDSVGNPPNPPYTTNVAVWNDFRPYSIVDLGTLSAN
ncbi:MAG: hypothetical protein DME18_11055, partial [Verrucomicrobia bacterium]